MTTGTTVTLHGEKNKTIVLALVVAVGLAVTFLLSRTLDVHRPPPDPNVVDESLYLNGKTARRMSLGFNGLAADWYWMRSLQYVGGKIVNMPTTVSLDNLGALNLKLLAPLLDTATTLDPEFLDPYEYAAVVLPQIDLAEAIRITKKGIDANPNAWRLYQHLGFIYWQQKDFQAASDAYGKGAQIPGAPTWMEAMKAKMLAEGGSRTTAREIYTRMYEQSTDEKVKEMARRRVLQVDALDQMDALRKLLKTFSERANRCPTSWKEIEPIFRSVRIPIDPSGAPLDPTGVPYVFGKTNCDIELNPKSEIPGR